MDLQAYRDEIKLKLTGNVLELELDDGTLDSLINSSLREIQRYIDTTKLITIPYSTCIDMTEYNPNSVSRVYRAEGYGITGNTGTYSGQPTYDPMYMGMWQMVSGAGNIYNLNNWIYNYGAWNTMLQIRNTIATDLVFRYDRTDNKLYIGCGFDNPEKITIEYIPRYNSVDEIKSDFWIDMLVRVAVAQAKIVVGRIRNRYTQSGALWSQDTGILEEGEKELDDLRQQMKESTMLSYPID